jgi:hypothetical protein
MRLPCCQTPFLADGLQGFHTYFIEGVKHRVSSDAPYKVGVKRGISLGTQGHF